MNPNWSSGGHMLCFGPRTVLRRQEKPALAWPGQRFVLWSQGKIQLLWKHRDYKTESRTAGKHRIDEEEAAESTTRLKR